MPGPDGASVAARLSPGVRGVILLLVATGLVIDLNRIRGIG